jgi:hypothetical protein
MSNLDRQDVQLVEIGATQVVITAGGPAAAASESVNPAPQPREIASLVSGTLGA